jgi:hypothetical protein
MAGTIWFDVSWKGNVEVEHVELRLVVELRQDRHRPRGTLYAAGAAPRRAVVPGPRRDVPRRQRLVHVVVVVQGQADLLEIVRAARPPGGFPRLLNGGQQQRDQDRDNRDHHQQFNQGESPMTM